MLFAVPSTLKIASSSNSRNLLGFFQTHATSYYFYSKFTEHCKVERRKNLIANHSPFPMFQKPYRNLKSENSQDYAQKPQRNYTFMNSASGEQRREEWWRLLLPVFLPGQEKTGQHAGDGQDRGGL
jgi:hypothetical protein